MSQLIFPSLRGVGWPVQRIALAPPVQIKKTPSGREFRFRDSAIPQYRYSLSFEFLRHTQGYTEWQQLMGFFNRVGGAFDDWLFDDRDDRQAVDQLFAVGDGVTSRFQLARTLGGFLEPVYGLNGVPVIRADGQVVAPHAVSDLGEVVFAQPPAVGVQLRWSGLFFWRCRFSGDSLEFSRSFATFWESKKVEFLTLKPL